MILGALAGAGFWAVGIGVAFGHTKLAIAGVVVLAAVLLSVEWAVYKEFRDAPDHLDERDWQWPTK